jgi:hypothetical protein
LRLATIVLILLGKNPRVIVDVTMSDDKLDALKEELQVIELWDCLVGNDPDDEIERAGFEARRMRSFASSMLRAAIEKEVLSCH